MDLYSLIIKVPGKGRAAGPSSRPGEKMVEEQEELVRKAREEHWAVWGLENGPQKLWWRHPGTL